MSQPGVQPQPTPVTMRLGHAQAADGGPLAVVRLELVTGSTIIFLTPGDLAAFAEQMGALAATLANKPIIAIAMPAVPAALAAPGPNGNGRRH